MSEENRLKKYKNTQTNKNTNQKNSVRKANSQKDKIHNKKLSDVKQSVADKKNNRKKRLKTILIIFVISSIVGTAFCFGIGREDVTTVFPDPTTYFYVNDYSGVLSEEVESYIYKEAKELYQLTKAQIVVVAVPDTASDSLETYSNHLANQWGIGDDDLDNGVLILFTTKEAHVRLEIGYGLEGCLPDSKCGRILDDYAVEDMHDGNWNQAAINTWKATAAEVYGEYDIEVPEELLVNSTVSADAESNTLADATFPEPLITKNEDPFLMQILASFVVFWIFNFIPFTFVCICLFSGRGRKRSKYDSSYNDTDSYWSSGDSDYSSCDSGGGGDFGGGGASR